MDEKLVGNTTCCQFDVILLRHAESFNNTLYEVIRKNIGTKYTVEDFEAEERRLRQPDSTLSDRGFKQVEKLRSFLKAGGWSHIVKDEGKWVTFTSPMKRCLITSGAIHDGLGVPVVVDPTLYEAGGLYDANGGPLSGTTADEILRAYPYYSCLPGMENGFYSHGGGKETEDVSIERAYQLSIKLWEMCLACIGSESSNSKHGAIVVCHGIVLSALINCLVTQSRNAKMCLFVHENSGYSHLELHVSGSMKAAAMKQFNGHSHLTCSDGNVDSSNSLRCGNHSSDDNWLQEFFTAI